MKVPAFLSPYLDGAAPTRLIQGLAAGVIATLVIGFNWGGWELGSRVEEKVSSAREMATVTALAPICAHKYQLAAKDNVELVAELKAVRSWERDSHLTKAGWVTFPGGSEPNNAVAEACATLLTTILKLDL